MTEQRCGRMTRAEFNAICAWHSAFRLACAIKCNGVDTVCTPARAEAVSKVSVAEKVIPVRPNGVVNGRSNRVIEGRCYAFGARRRLDELIGNNPAELGYYDGLIVGRELARAVEKHVAQWRVGVEE